MKKTYNSPLLRVEYLSSREDILTGSVNIDSDGLFEDEEDEE